MRCPALLLLAGLVPAAAGGTDPQAEDLPVCPDGTILVPGGSFRLGATQKLVKVKTFCLDRTEVTVAAYEVCVLSEHCSSEGISDASWATYPLYEDHPVNYVTWAQADNYCRARYKRLPTEAEWEWAARSGPAENVYPWGDEPPASQLCWNGEGNDLGKGKRDQTCPVLDHFDDQTLHGIIGMGGNVAEWTSTPGKKGERIVRGGDWGADEPRDVRGDYRRPLTVDEHLSSIGFRCAEEPPPEKPGS